MSTFNTAYDGPARGSDAIAHDRARALLGQVMGYVAVTVGFAALGAYLGRDLSGATGVLLFIVGFAAIVGLNVAVAGGPRATRARAAVRARSAARPGGRPADRRLRGGRPVGALAGGRRDRGVRRSPWRLRLRHA